MVRLSKPLALVGAAFLMSAAPAFAEDFNLNPLGVDLDPLHIFTPVPATYTGPNLNPLNVDLDPLHIVTPASVAAPAPAPAPKAKHHRRFRKHVAKR